MAMSLGQTNSLRSALSSGQRPPRPSQRPLMPTDGSASRGHEQADIEEERIWGEAALIG